MAINVDYKNNSHMAKLRRK